MKTAPQGFLFNGIDSGIKKKAKDLGIIISTTKTNAVGFFTSNEFQSESLIVSKEHVKRGNTSAIIVNSGCANCALGKKGLNAALKICARCAKEIGLSKEDILIASTGPIGTPLPEEKIINNIKKLVTGASREKVMDFANAIMTTDKYPKYVSVRLRSGVRIAAIAKGAGMIEPNLATTLCFLLTDAKIKRVSFRKILKQSLDLTFNRISIDANQSTNDTFIALANGASKIDVEKSRENLAEFIAGVFSVLGELSYQVVKNGEGATKVVRIKVKRARNKVSAEKIARKLASSLLFKTSIYGNSANWGRIIASVGSLKLGVGRNFDVYYGKTKVLSSGVSLYQNKIRADNYLKNNNEVEIIIDLKKGKSEFHLYTTDLSPEYVELNK